jgi:hypothetical protein
VFGVVVDAVRWVGQDGVDDGVGDDTQRVEAVGLHGTPTPARAEYGSDRGPVIHTSFLTFCGIVTLGTAGYDPCVKG